MKPKILIADKIHKDAVEDAKTFADITEKTDITPEQLMDELKNYDAIVIRSRTKVRKDLIEASNLKAIARAGVGLDNVDVDFAKEKGIKVFNAPESLTISVAEHAFGLMFALLRCITKADSSLRSCKWEKKKYVGVELYGKTLGLVGFGRIGREVALRARAMGMEILVYDPFITIEDVREYNAEHVELDELLEKSDVISLHLPATEKTKGLIDKEKLSKMKGTAVLINTARGKVINEKDLIEALKSNQIKGAALDVYETEPLGESPLLELDNVVLTPHIGSGTEDAQRTAGIVVIDKLKTFFTQSS